MEPDLMASPEPDSLLLEREALDLAAQDDFMELLIFKKVDHGQANKANIRKQG